MNALWLAVVALLLGSLCCLIVPLLRRGPPAGPRSADSLRAFYAAQREQLRRDRQQGALSADAHMRAEEELQRDLLQDMARRDAPGGGPAGRRASLAAACALALGLPLAAALLYGKLGNPRAAASAAAAQGAPAHAGSEDDMDLAIFALARRLRAAPDDADGWYTLARSYETLGRYDDAVAAYREVLRLVPGQPAVLADLADARLSQQGGQPDAESVAAVAQALAAQPDQPKALALAGMMALRRGDPVEALAYWERLRPQLPPGSEASRQIESNIARARAAAGPDPMARPLPAREAAARAEGPAAANAGTGTGSASPARPGAAARIAGRASIAPAAAARVRPDDTVFILARPAGGSRMPLAVLRLRAADLPRDFVLDDSLAMSPQARLSGAQRVDLEIRVSRSGNAMAQPGDLAGIVENVPVPAEGLELKAGPAEGAGAR